MSPKISKRITTLNFIFTCTIVLYHAKRYYTPDGAVDAYLNVFHSSVIGLAATLAMCFFFCVTGFLLFSSLTMENYGNKMKKRVRSLLVPYLAWQAIAVAIGLHYNEYWSLSSLFRTMFLLEFTSPDGPLWYVYAVFVLALFSPLMLVFLKDKKTGFIYTTTGALFVIPAVQHIMPRYFMDETFVANILWYLPAYLFGAYFGRFYSDGSDKAQVYEKCVAIIFFSMLADIVIPDQMNTITTCIMPIFLLFSCPSSEWLVQSSLPSMSFVLYALHIPLMRFTAGPAFNIAYHLYFASAITTAGSILVLVFDLIFVVIFFTTLQKFAPRTLSILTGGRVQEAKS